MHRGWCRRRDPGRARAVGGMRPGSTECPVGLRRRGGRGRRRGERLVGNPAGGGAPEANASGSGDAGALCRAPERPRRTTRRSHASDARGGPRAGRRAAGRAPKRSRTPRRRRAPDPGGRPCAAGEALEWRRPSSAPAFAVQGTRAGGGGLLSAAGAPVDERRRSGLAGRVAGPHARRRRASRVSGECGRRSRAGCRGGRSRRSSGDRRGRRSRAVPRRIRRSERSRRSSGCGRCRAVRRAGRDAGKRAGRGSGRPHDRRRYERLRGERLRASRQRGPEALGGRGADRRRGHTDAGRRPAGRRGGAAEAERGTRCDRQEEGQRGALLADRGLEVAAARAVAQVAPERGAPEVRAAGGRQRRADRRARRVARLALRDERFAGLEDEGAFTLSRGQARIAATSS